MRKNALITGANSGIGLATARLFNLPDDLPLAERSVYLELRYSWPRRASRWSANRRWPWPARGPAPRRPNWRRSTART